MESENYEIRHELHEVLTSKREWIGRTLKMEFILRKMIQAGAIQPDHAEWVIPMFEEIDIPHVPISIKEDFVPTTLTGLVDDSSEEEEFTNIIIMNPPDHYSLPWYIRRYPTPTERMAIILIQNAWRNRQ